MTFTVDELAQEIRRVDGSNSLGAGALAEALIPFVRALRPSEQPVPVAWRWRVVGARVWSLRSDRPDFDGRVDLEFQPLYAQPSEQTDLTVIDAAEWTPCSPSWLEAHPNQCGKAPRVWDENRHNHCHPVHWPSEQTGGFDIGELTLALECLANDAEKVRRMLHADKERQGPAMREIGIPFVASINNAKAVLARYDRAALSPTKVAG